MANEARSPVVLDAVTYANMFDRLPFFTLRLMLGDVSMNDRWRLA